MAIRAFMPTAKSYTAMPVGVAFGILEKKKYKENNK